MNSESYRLSSEKNPMAAEEAGRVLRDRDAVGAHFGRHAAERLVDAVLHVDRRQVRVAADLERAR